MTKLMGWLGALVLAMASASATGAEYVTYLHADVQGSPLMATDEQGQVVWQEEYEPWGARQVKDAASATPGRGSKVWYTGKEEEASLGMYYYGARWYAPAVAQFTATDPAPVSLKNSRSFSRYAYANNNPVRYVDPDGRIPVDTVWDFLNVAYDAGKMGVGYAISNPKLVAEGGFDLAVDSAAMAIPYVPAGSSKVARLLGKAGKEAENIAEGASAANKLEKAAKADDVIHVTADGVALPPGSKYQIPDIFVQNPHGRNGSFGVIEEGKFRERLRIDPATPPGQKGPNYSHYHLDGKGKHYSPREGDKDPGFGL